MIAQTAVIQSGSSQTPTFTPLQVAKVLGADYWSTMASGFAYESDCVKTLKRKLHPRNFQIYALENRVVPITELKNENEAALLATVKS